MRIAWIIDSSSSLTKKETEDRGWFFLPLTIVIDGKEYQDGVDIFSEEYYKMIKIEMETRTSASSPALIKQMIKKLLKEYDHVIFYPLSIGLSSQANNISMILRDYDNVHCINSKSVGHVIVSDIEILEKMNNNGATIEEIITKANILTSTNHGVALPTTMDWLVKGGRVSPKAAAMAKMLKIVPIISFTNVGKLDKFGKGRTVKKTWLKVVQTLLDNENNIKNLTWTIYHGGNENIKEYAESISEIIGFVPKITWFPPIIGVHTGPGVIAIILHEKNV